MGEILVNNKNILILNPKWNSAAYGENKLCH